MMAVKNFHCEYAGVGESTSSALLHHESSQSITNRKEGHIQEMMKYIEERGSPFSAECPSVLQNFVTKEMMTEEIRKDVLNASEIGKKKYEAFHSDQITKKMKLNETRKLHLQANVTKKVIILRNPSYRLQALRESRPPWLRQIITPIFPNVIMLSLGGERLTPKVLNHYLHHDLGMQQLLCYFYAHLLILEYSDHQQNLISSSLYYPGALRKISSQSVHTFLSNVYSQTDRQTNTTKNITSFAKEVKIAMSYIQMLRSCNTHHIINSLTGYPIGLTGLPY